MELRQRGRVTAAEVREGLITLAGNAARFAHQQAKCDAPSKVTG